MIVAPPTATAPGPLRNIGATNVDTSWLYLADANVAPLASDYLTRALATAGDGAFVQPAMLRLVGPPPQRPVVEWRLRDKPTEGEYFCFVAADPHGILDRLPGEHLKWENDAPMVRPPSRYQHPDDAAAAGQPATTPTRTTKPHSRACRPSSATSPAQAMPGVSQLPLNRRLASPSASRAAEFSIAARSVRRSAAAMI